jgi:hypothetical protein
MSYWDIVFWSVDKMQVKKRGRPKGSKNKPKPVQKKPGRPKGSKNKPKLQPKKRGRPKKEKQEVHPWARCPGISLVQRKPGPKSDSHRWIAVSNNQVIGYYRTPEEAEKAYNENTKEDKTKDKRNKR